MKIGSYEVVRLDKYNIAVGKMRARPSDDPKGAWKKGDMYLHVVAYFDDLRQALKFLYNQRMITKKDDRLDVVKLAKRIQKFRKELQELVPAIKCSDDFKFVPRTMSEEHKEKARIRMKKMHETKKAKREER